MMGVTGHRPSKWLKYGQDGYDWNCPLRLWLREEIKDHLLRWRPDGGITGMAQGVDQDFAYVCCEIGLPFVAAVPFRGQEATWPEDIKNFYYSLLARAYHVAVVCEGGYEDWKYQKRNEWLVDNSQHLMAIWDGAQEGGTWNCVKYARKVGRNIDIINPARWEHDHTTNL